MEGSDQDLIVDDIKKINEGDLRSLLSEVPHYQTSHGSAFGYSTRALIEKAHFYNKGYGLYKFDSKLLKEKQIVSPNFGGSQYSCPRSAGNKLWLQKQYKLLGNTWDDTNTYFSPNRSIRNALSTTTSLNLPASRSVTQELTTKVSSAPVFESANKDIYASEYVSEFCRSVHEEDHNRSRELAPYSPPIIPQNINMPYFSHNPCLTLVGNIKMKASEHSKENNDPTITIAKMKQPHIVNDVRPPPQVPANFEVKQYVLNHKPTIAIKEKTNTLHSYVDSDTLDKYVKAAN
jgi:hypothetical protein